MGLASVVAYFVYFAVAEVDRIRTDAAKFEAELLRNGYCSIRLARCSMQADAECILADIGAKVGAVDHKIQVLMRAGMWNRGLRAAAGAGVDVKSAALVEFAPASAGSMVMAIVAVGHFLKRD